MSCHMTLIIQHLDIDDFIIPPIASVQNYYIIFHEYEDLSIICGLIKMVFLKIIPKKSGLLGVCCGFFIAIGGIVGWIVMPYLVVKLIDLVFALIEKKN